MKTTHAGLNLVKSADVPDWQEICHRMDPAPRLNIGTTVRGWLVLLFLSGWAACGAYGAWVPICRFIARWM